MNTETTTAKELYGVEIHANGKHNDAIIRMVTNHNEGLASLTFGILTGYIHARFCEFPTIMPVVEINDSVGKNGKRYEIKEDSKPTLTITVKEELAPTLHRQNEPQ